MLSRFRSRKRPNYTCVSADYTGFTHARKVTSPSVLEITWQQSKGVSAPQCQQPEPLSCTIRVLVAAEKLLPAIDAATSESLG